MNKVLLKWSKFAFTSRVFWLRWAQTAVSWLISKFVKVFFFSFIIWRTWVLLWDGTLPETWRNGPRVRDQKPGWYYYSFSDQMMLNRCCRLADDANEVEPELARAMMNWPAAVVGTEEADRRWSWPLKVSEPERLYTGQIGYQLL